MEGKAIVGIRFKPAGEIFYLTNPGIDLKVGERCIVRLEKGKELAYVVQLLDRTNNPVSTELKLLRAFKQEDEIQLKRNAEREIEAFEICEKKIAKLNLPMQLIRVKYTFDGSRITFYFKAPTKVDFRQLVRELAQVFKTRIELRQISSREEAEMIGGVGICGRIICCHGVSSSLKKWIIQSSKEGSLDQGIAKVSGVCGRLMCCLKYEQSGPLASRLYRPPEAGTSVLVEEEQGKVVHVDYLKRRIFIATKGVFYRELSFEETKKIVKVLEGDEEIEETINSKNAATGDTRAPELERALKEAAASAPSEEELAPQNESEDEDEDYNSDESVESVEKLD